MTSPHPSPIVRPDKPPGLGFAIERDGRVVRLDAVSEAPVAAVRLEGERIAIEVNGHFLSAATMAVLRHWLLTMLGDDRPFRILETDRSRVSHRNSAIDALQLIENLLIGASLSPSHLAGFLPMIAGPGGIAPLDDPMKERLGFFDGNDEGAAISLIRSGERIAFLPEANRLTVLAKVPVSAEVMKNACAWLSAQGAGPVRLRIWLGQGWVNEPARTGLAASKRLLELSRLERLQSPLPIYHGRRIRAEELGADELKFFAPLLALSGRSFDNRSFTALLRSGFGDRLFLAGVREGEARHIVCPSTYDYLGPKWHLRAPGQRIIDQPDRAYCRYVNERMVATAEEGALHIERVQAGIRESDDDLRLGDTRLTKYLRIAIPFRRGSESLVMSYSIQKRWDASPVAA